LERQTATTEGIRGRDRRILALPYLSRSPQRAWRVLQDEAGVWGEFLVSRCAARKGDMSLTLSELILVRT